MDVRVLEQHGEVMRGSRMMAYAEKNLSAFYDVKSPRMWQPSDVIPSAADPDAIRAFQAQAAGLRSSVLAVFIGDMVTEDALPTYMSALNRVYGIRDATGMDDHAWARAIRWWTAEENRHGMVMDRYLAMHPRVDMRKIEETIQYLIQASFDPGAVLDPYRTFVYTTQQERATLVSHNNVAKLAQQDGDLVCAALCRRIAGDEGRHERFYAGAVKEILAEDPDGGVIAIYDMVKDGIRMPAELMYDGVDRALFKNYALVAAGIGVLTPQDMLAINREYLEKWGVAHLAPQTGEGRAAQDRLCALLEEEQHDVMTLQALLERRFRRGEPRFSWMREN